jgi:predicted nucleotidyltransferase
MTGMPYGLKDETVEAIHNVFAKYPEVDAAILYGSRAKGNFKPGSDIDLTLKGESLNLKLLNKISLEIDDLLLPYNVDLSIYHQIDNPELIDHIERVGRIFYQSP